MSSYQYLENFLRLLLKVDEDLANCPGKAKIDDVALHLEYSLHEKWLSENLDYLKDLRKQRLTLLKKIIRDAHGDPELMELFFIVLEDIRLVRQLPEGSTKVGNVTAVLEEWDVREIINNISKGLSIEKANKYIYETHSLHLLRKAVEYPGVFIDSALEGLEQQPKETILKFILERKYPSITSQSDLDILVSIPPIRYTGFKEYFFREGVSDLSLTISIDSKVSGDPQTYISSKINQQINLFYGDRLEKDILPLLEEMNKFNLSITEREEFFGKHIHSFFQHFVGTPNDVSKSVRDSLGKFYEPSVINSIPAHLSRIVAQGSSDYKIIGGALETHIKNHFGTGEFIKYQVSDITSKMIK